MDPEPPSLLLDMLQPFSFSVLLSFIAMLLLLVCSALISGSEVAFFSLSPQAREELGQSTGRAQRLVTELLQKPKTLLATILIGNNFVNVAIIILSTFIMENLFDFTGREFMGFLIQVVAVTLIILLLGEIIPKVYATTNAIKLAVFMAYPMSFMRSMFLPLSKLLVRSTQIIDKRARLADQNSHISVNELSHALELTSDHGGPKMEERKILQGIVKFGATEVTQVMTPRLDVIAVEESTSYEKLLQEIVEHSFSRIPVYKENLDNVIGVLYVKDLLPYLEEEKGFNWLPLVRQPYYVPENKKLDDLLSEFQEKKMHMAIVVDEYGGSCGVITLEDVIEEIVGEISDEFDDDDVLYSKLDDNNYVFEAKTPLMDVYRALDIDGTIFEANKGDAETLAGLVLELAGRIPQKNEKIKFENYLFTIEASDRRRIKRVKITINNDVPKK